MSRSGYSDDYGDDFPNQAELYRQSVMRATKGYRGQHLLKKLRAALDAMPVKRLITGVIQDPGGDVCAFGALDPKAPGMDGEDDYGESAEVLAKHFGVARALAAQVVYMNDEYDWRCAGETPEQRWSRMRAWVDSQITPAADDSLDPVLDS